jgi:hypothetical protein
MHLEILKALHSPNSFILAYSLTSDFDNYLYPKNLNKELRKSNRNYSELSNVLDTIWDTFKLKVQQVSVSEISGFLLKDPKISLLTELNLIRLFQNIQKIEPQQFASFAITHGADQLYVLPILHKFRSLQFKEEIRLWRQGIDESNVSKVFFPGFISPPTRKFNILFENKAVEFNFIQQGKILKSLGLIKSNLENKFPYFATLFNSSAIISCTDQTSFSNFAKQWKSFKKHHKFDRNFSYFIKFHPNVLNSSSVINRIEKITGLKSLNSKLSINWEFVRALPLEIFLAGNSKISYLGHNSSALYLLTKNQRYLTKYKSPKLNRLDNRSYRNFNYLFTICN